MLSVRKYLWGVMETMTAYFHGGNIQINTGCYEQLEQNPMHSILKRPTIWILSVIIHIYTFPQILYLDFSIGSTRFQHILWVLFSLGFYGKFSRARVCLFLPRLLKCCRIHLNACLLAVELPPLPTLVNFINEKILNLPIYAHKKK